MPINASDARQLSKVILNAYFEDYSTVAAILKPLRAQWPTIDWMAELSTMALTHQPFIDSGLSIQWWLDEVNRQSQP